MNHYQIPQLTVRTFTALNSIGKRCFVNCWELAHQQNGRLTVSDIIKCDPEVGRGALDLRRSFIMRIFNEGQEYVALNKCCDSKRLSPATVTNARSLWQDTSKGNYKTY